MLINRFVTCASQTRNYFRLHPAKSVISVLRERLMGYKKGEERHNQHTDHSSYSKEIVTLETEPL